MGHCPVCGGALAEGRLVACARCDAPHHLDCIEWSGTCAIFGCGSRAYRDALKRLSFVARPPPPPEVVIKPGATGLVVPLSAPVVRIEARSELRTRRVAFGLGAAAAAAMLGAGALLLPGAIRYLPLVLRYLVELFPLVGLQVIGIAVLMAIGAWFAKEFLPPATAYTLGWLVQQADGSDFVLDVPARRLVRRARYLGTVLGERSWHGSAIKLLALTLSPDDQRVRLHAQLYGGGSILLAEDGLPYMSGYHWTDLARIGGRMAAALEVPFESRLPWKLDALLPEKPA